MTATPPRTARRELLAVTLPCGWTGEVLTTLKPERVQTLAETYVERGGRYGALRHAAGTAGIEETTAASILGRLGLSSTVAASLAPPEEACPSKPARSSFSRWGRTLRSAHPYGTLRRLCDAYEEATRLFDAEPVETAARAAGMKAAEARRVLGKLGVAS